MQIYLARNNQQAGPYTLEELNQMLATQQVLLTDLAWHQGMKEWKPLGELTQGKFVYQPQLAPTAQPPLPEFNTAPQAESVTTTSTTAIKKAGVVKRMFAKFIDFLIFSLPQLVVSFMHFPFDEVMKLNGQITAEDQMRIVQIFVDSIPNTLEYALLGYALFILFLQNELVKRSGQTIAKKLFKLRIVDATTHQLTGSFRGFFVRSFLFLVMVQFVGLFPLLALVLMLDFVLLFSKENRTLHDRFARTKVIDISK